MLSTVRRFAVAVTHRRYAASTVSATAGSRGRKVLGFSVDTPAQAAIWDAPGTTLDRLRQGGVTGRIIAGAIDVADLRTADAEGQTPADVIVWDGQAFEVQEITRYPAGVGAPTWTEFAASATERVANPEP